MRQRLSIITLLTALALSVSAQQPGGIEAMDLAVNNFCHSRELMAHDTHWSRNQQEWAFKHVATADGPAWPTALTALLDAFSQQAPQAASSYFHSAHDGQQPFATLVYQRKDNYYSGIVGAYDIKDNYNFRLLNFRDAEGLVSYGVMWFENDFTDRSGQPFRTVDGRLFKFYGGIWQMQPFRQDNPWEPRDKTARRPVSQSERALYETLLSQMQYLSGLYQQNRQSGNEQNCDAIAYTMKNLMEGYEGTLTRRQYMDVVRLVPAFDKTERQSERARMVGKGTAKLAKCVMGSPMRIEYQQTNEGAFVSDDQLRLLPLEYTLADDGTPHMVEVTLTGPTAVDAGPVKVTPVYPRQEAFEAEMEHDQFTLTADFNSYQLLEVSDAKGRRMLLFADTTATTVDLTTMTLKGSPLNERFAGCQRRLDVLKPELNKYVSKFGFNHDFEVMDTEGFASLAAEAHQLQMQLIEENTDNLIPAWYLADNYTTMTLEELSRYMKKYRPYSYHVALQPVWKWYEGLQKRQTGQRFHDGACVDTAGVAHRLSDYIGRGDYVVLNFWSTREIMTRSSCKTMKQLAKEHEGKNLRVVGFALDGDKQTWSRYVKARKLTYEHLSAPAAGAKSYEQWTSEVAQAYGIQALPETIVFDPKGRIVSTGLMGDPLKALVRSLPLKKK